MTGATTAAGAVVAAAVSKSYGSAPVLRGVDLEVPAGSVTAILGASGSGKTTLLRLIAGFDTVDGGCLSVGGRVVDDGRRTVPARRRGIGYVPQDAALFPHLSAAGNVGFGLARRDRRRRVADLLDLVGLTGLAHRYPNQLSGGQQQRVALARALAIRPTVVLLDEPFGSLDAALRDTVRAEVLAILAAAGTTTVLVTHDQDEALAVAEHVALLDAGIIAAAGTPGELYRHPASPQVAAAIGSANILRGRTDGSRVSCLAGTLRLDADCMIGPGAGECQILLRPEQLRVSATAIEGALPATVAARRYHGHDTVLALDVAAPDDGDPVTLAARVSGQDALEPGQPVWVTVTTPVHAWRAG